MRAHTYHYNGLTTINPGSLKFHIDMFWGDVFKVIVSEKPSSHLLLIIRVKYDDEDMG